MTVVSAGWIGWTGQAHFGGLDEGLVDQCISPDEKFEVLNRPLLRETVTTSGAHAGDAAACMQGLSAGSKARKPVISSEALPPSSRDELEEVLDPTAETTSGERRSSGKWLDPEAVRNIER